MNEQQEDEYQEYARQWAAHATPTQVVGVVVAAGLWLLLLALVVMASQHGG